MPTAGVKSRIQGARQRALLAANAEQIRLYHDIGWDILERQKREGWGAKVIGQLSSDLRAAFPDMKGLSSRNLHYMRLFAEKCPHLQFVQQTAAQLQPTGQQSAAQLSSSAQISQQTADQLPWFHIVTLLTKLADPALREWYARQAIQHSWPRDTLAVQIRSTGGSAMNPNALILKKCGKHFNNRLPYSRLPLPSIGTATVLP
jgi:predicted nuclease of restriction endonuclease-like (RecB) superfamily